MGEDFEADLGAAFDSANDDGPARDDQGRFSSDNTDDEAPEGDSEEEIPGETDTEDQDGDNADAGEDEAEGSEDAAGDATSVDAPESWTAEAKERFAALDPETQAYIVQREQEQAEGVTKLKSQFEDKVSSADQFAEVVRPYEAEMRAEGATPLQAVQTLLNTAQILRHGTVEQKEAVIRQTAQQYGVNLNPINDEGTDDEFADPRVAALEREITALKSVQTNQDTQNQQAQANAAQAEIETFADAKDDKGDPLRPHFDAVVNDLIPALSAIKQANPAMSNADALQDAYDRAVWANPETRKLEQDRQAKTEEEARTEAARKAATDAKKGKGVKAKGAGQQSGKPKASANPKDWDAGLGDVFDRASSA